MSSIKVVDINEEAKREEPVEKPIEEAKEEHEVSCSIREPLEEVKEEAVNKVLEQPIIEQEPKNEDVEVKKPEKAQDKMITCPKCQKSMKLKSYRYKHEKNCQGTLEQKPVKSFSKPRAKPKAQPKAQPKIENTEEQIKNEIKNDIIKREPLPPPALSRQLSASEIARQSYIQMKEALKQKRIEKINNFKSKMF